MYVVRDIMAFVQFDSVDNKVSFDSATDKVQVVEAGCAYCSGIIPQKVKVTFSGILYCPGLGNCCPDDARDKVTSKGIGWNGDIILTPGRALFTDGNFNNWYKEVDPIVDCWWSNVTYDDFGSFETYAGDDCSSELLGVSTFTVRRVAALITATGGGMLTLDAQLGHTGYSKGFWNFYLIARIHGSYLDGCFPYGVDLFNEYLCADPPGDCVGDGKAVMTDMR